MEGSSLIAVLFICIHGTVHVQVQCDETEIKGFANPSENKILTTVVNELIDSDSSEENSNGHKASINMNESHTPLGDIGSLAKENYLNNEDNSDSDEFDLFFREFLKNAKEIDWKNLGIDFHDVFAVSGGSGKSQHGYGYGQRHGGAGASSGGLNVGQTSDTTLIGGDSSLSELGGSITHGAASSLNSELQRTSAMLGSTQHGTVPSANDIGYDQLDFLSRYGGLLTGASGSPGYIGSSISGSASGSDSWSELIRNDAFLARLRALLKAKMMASGEWQKWISSEGTASSKGFLAREQPSHILQVIKGKMGKNNIGVSARTVFGGSNWYEMKTSVARNQTSQESPIPIVRSQINNTQ